VSSRGQLAGEQYGGGADGSSRWDIGSIRKSFTSALAGQLIDEGIVSLDTPACERWPQIAELSQRAEDREITLQQLLGSTSGWLTDDLPGRRFRYNNAAFTAAEHVIAGTLGREPAPEVVDRFARPLGLENFVAYHRAMPFDPASFGDPGPKLVIECCLRDLVAWGNVWVQGGAHGGRQLIPADYVALATSPSGPSPDSHYGYCWFVNAGRALWPSASDDAFGHPGHGFYTVGPQHSRAFLWASPGLRAVAAVSTGLSAGIAEDYLDVPMGTTGEWIAEALAALDGL
jgi:CubicO group peptidase (beta-lactamase class C family)